MRGVIDGEYIDGEVRGVNFIGGMGGFGKTTEMIRLISACSGCVCFWDEAGTHAPKLRGFVSIHDIPTLARYLKRNFGRAWRIRYEPTSGKRDAHFSALCRLLYIHGKELTKRTKDLGIVLAVDEIDARCGPHHGTSWMQEEEEGELYSLVNWGRHARIALIGVARYANGVARGFVSQCVRGSLRFFRLSDPEHRKYFWKSVGKEAIERTRTLEKFQFLLFELGSETPKLCGGRRR